MDVTWKNNLMNQGKYTSFAYTSTQVITGKDAKMTLAGTTINMYEPAAGSALTTYSTTDYPEVALDIRGRDRGTTAKLPGASQILGTVSKEMPKKTSVGSTFFPVVSTAVNTLQQTADFNAVAANGRIISTVSAPGKLTVFNLTGQSLAQQSLESGSNIFNAPERGIYILKFSGNNGDTSTRKILVQ